LITSTRLRQTLLCCLLGWGAALTAGAQNGATPKAGSPSASTRLVTLWAAQENALDEALQKRDAAGVAARLASEFEFQTTQPARQLDAKGWIKLEHSVSDADRQLRELQVRELGDVVFVSFVRVTGSRTLNAHWVVDVWRVTDNKLLKRYASPAWRTRAVDARPDGRH
jgi:ketosteroid isomerase-like protein